VVIDGRRRHVISYLEDFLFPPDRSRAKVRVLSGGERNRLLLARLFTKPSNLLVLDEPTNDLDADTLELLEDLLVEYTGTVLLVSHDRDFLNEVVSSTFVFEGGGRVTEYVGGYDDWVRQRPAAAAGDEEEAPAPPAPTPGRQAGAQTLVQAEARAGAAARPHRAAGAGTGDAPPEAGRSGLLQGRRR
jgi:ATP-binding cassette subfamily F protein uup